MSYPHPPESKAAVRRAGKNIAGGSASQQDIDLVDQWRASHGYVINTFQIWLRRAIKRQNIAAEFAQRLKRRKTVIDKLQRVRPDGTPLISDVTSMHDFAGCRLIFDTIEDLVKFREALHSNESMRNVRHSLRHDLNKYNYIENPKPTGYRGIHDVFRHFPRSHRTGDTASLPWHGLQVEIQYRTRVQHAWATALEISDIIDAERTKFGFAQDKRGQFFVVASEILARKHENLKRAFPEKGRDQLSEELSGLEKDLGILQRLRALRQFEGFEQLRKHNVLNIYEDENRELKLDVASYQNATIAIQAANDLESSEESINAVYVRADNPNQLRSAYRNYFNDPLDFVQMLEGET